MIGSVLALAIAGCGGSSGTTAPRLHSLPEIRAAVQHSVDAKLEKQGLPAKEIACVDHNIAALTERQIAELLVESGPPETEGEGPAPPPGSLGRGCP